MRSDELQHQLEAQEQERASLITTLDELFLAAREEIGRAAAEWIPGAVAERIQEQSDDVERVGRERMKEMKSRIADLTTRMQVVVENLTSAKSAWLHRRAPGTPGNGPNPAGYFQALLSETACAVAPILAEYGFLNYHVGTRGKFLRDPGGKYRYTGSINFDGSKTPNVIKYGDRFARLQSLNYSIASTQTAISKAKAAEMWDSL